MSREPQETSMLDASGESREAPPALRETPPAGDPQPPTGADWGAFVARILRPARPNGPARNDP